MILDGDVVLGSNNIIHPYCVLIGPLVIGDNNIIGPHAVIGSPGQDTRNPRYDSKNKKITIGSNNIIREFVSIHKPAYADLTSIKDNCYLMNNSHVSHDSHVESGAVLSMSSVLAGLVTVLDNATLAMNVSIHQKCVVGHYAIAGQGAAVVKNIKPFSRLVPGKPISVNTYAVKKFGFEHLTEQITEYVLRGLMPKDNFLLEKIMTFEKMHIDSKKRWMILAMSLICKGIILFSIMPI